jgi:putative ABC transport system ATP-binding protein
MPSSSHVAVPSRVLELVAARVGTPLSLEAAHEAARVSHQSDWALALAHSARRAGLRPSDFAVENAAELGRLLTLGTPAVLSVGDRWVIALGGDQRSSELVLVDRFGEQQRPLRVSSLADWLHVHGAKFPLRWVALEPRMMLASTERAPSVYRRLLAIWRLERPDISVSLVLGVAMAAVSLAVPIAAQSLVNMVAATAMAQPLAMIGFILLLALSAAGVLHVMQIAVVERIHQRLWVRSANDWIRRLPRYARRARNRHSVHDLANRFFDVALLQKATTSLLIDGTSLVLTTGASLILLAFYHPWLFVFDAVLVVGFAAVVLVGWAGSHKADEESTCKYQLFAWMDDVAAGRVLFADARGRAFADARGELLLRKWLKARRTYFASNLRQVITGITLHVLATVGLLTLGGYLVIERELTFGQLVAASVLVSVIGSGLTRLGRQLDPLYEAAAAAGTFAPNLDAPLEQEGGLLLPHRDGGLAVELRDDGTGKLIAKVEPGQRLGLLGATAHHTRVFDVLYGLYGPERRPIRALLDGLETHVLDPESLRGQVTLVRGRETVWASVRDNLDVGRGAGDLELLELLDLVRLRDRILDLPEGLATLLVADSDGEPLDETDLRRLALVRGLLAKPRLLLLDRSLDGLGLDAADRARLYDWLFDRRRPWTLIVSTGGDTGAEVLARCDAQVEVTFPHGRKG